MTTAPKVSIIVPIYNKEKYLRATLESISLANYPAKEIILVDDYSTDNSPAIIADYCARVAGVVSVRHRTNERMSVARNTGLDLATGKYVHFWDADDLYDPEGMGRIVAEMEEDEADVGTGIAFRQGAPLKVYMAAMRSVRATTFADTPVAANNDSVCFKVYRRSFLLENDLRFVPGLYMQDVELNLRAMPLARKITVTPHCLGDYVFAENSASKGFSKAKFDSAFEVDRLTREFYVANSLQQWEPFRQARIVLAVFLPFVRHALRQVTSNYTFTGGHSHYIDGAHKAWTYINRFREALEGHVEGIRVLAKSEPALALGFIALLEGAIDRVLPLLGREPFNDSARDYFPSTNILSSQQVTDAFAQIPMRRSKIVEGHRSARSQSLSVAHPVQETVSRDGKRRILFLGPMGFTQGVWDTRYKYIFPNLLESLSPYASIKFLCGTIPDWATHGIEELKKQYDIEVEMIGRNPPNFDRTYHWAAEATRVGRSFKADVITNIFGPVTFGIAGGIAARAIGARMVLRVAGDEIASRIAIQSYKADCSQHRQDLMTECIGFNLADTIIVMSEQERQRVQQRLASRQERVVVCTRGIDLGVFKPRSGFDEQKLRSTFAFVGRKSLEKGYDLIEAAAQILEEEDLKVRFRFAGTFEPGSSGNKNYVGFVQAEDLPDFYAQADAFILCSRSEGFPQVVGEAMAMGLPCILSRHIFEGVFIDGHDALLVDLDASAIAQAIRRLANDRELGARLALRSCDIAREHFSKKTHSELYKKLIIG